MSSRKYNPKEIQDEIDIDSFDEILSFSLDWSNVQSTDIKLQRQPNGSFPVLNTSLFSAPGFYYLWWKAPFIEYEGYIQASDSQWHVKDIPKIQIQINSIAFNRKVEQFSLKEIVGEKDEFMLFESTPDCNPPFKIDGLQLSSDRRYLSVWFPEVS